MSQMNVVSSEVHQYKKILTSLDKAIKQRAIDLFKQNKRVPEIAKVLGVSRVRVLRWIPETVIKQRIDEFRKQGMSYAKIGKILGMSRNTVAKKAKISQEMENVITKMFLKEYPVSKIAHECKMKPIQVTARIPDSVKQKRLEELYTGQNLSIMKIGKRLGIDRKSVKNWVKKYGLKRSYFSKEKEAIEKLYLKTELSTKEIARELGLSERTLFRRIREYGIEQRKPIADIDEGLIITDHIHHLQGMKGIAREYRMGRDTVRKILSKAGVNILSVNTSKLKAHSTGRFIIPISRELSEIINGELLGDGGIECQTDKYGMKWKKSIDEYKSALDKLKSINKLDYTNIVKEYNKLTTIILKAQIAKFILHKSKEETDWVNFIAQKFEQNKYPVKILHKDTIYSYSNASVQLYKLYQKWYPNGKKSIPRDLKLTPQTVLHWYIGDGHYVNYCLGLSTKCFNKKENQFLSNLLYDETGIPVRIQKIKDKRYSKIYYSLAISRSQDIKKFFSYLELAPRTSLSLAKQTFPWKFSKKRKKDLV